MNKVATTDKSTAQTAQIGETRTRKTRPRKSDWMVPERPISIRFEPEMIQRLDRIAIQLSKLNVNIRIGRSSVVKLATERALAAIEAELSLVGDKSSRA
jgi:predicted DNA-binding protein